MAQIKANQNIYTAQTLENLPKEARTRPLSFLDLQKRWHVQRDQVASWHGEYSSKIYAYALRHAARAHQDWLKGDKGFPRFKARHFTRPSFTTSGSVLLVVRARMDDEVWHAIRETPGVTGFVGSDDQNPAPLSKREVARFLGEGAHSAEEGGEVRRSLWQVGEGVRTVAGPFADMSGVVAGIDEEGSKPVVLVDIFGRDTPVEMAATDIVKP